MTNFSENHNCMYLSKTLKKRNIYSGTFYCVWVLIKMKSFLFTMSYFNDYVFQMNCHYLWRIGEVSPEYEWIQDVLVTTSERTLPINFHFVKYHIAFLFRIINNSRNKTAACLLLIFEQNARITSFIC